MKTKFLSLLLAMTTMVLLFTAISVSAEGEFAFKLDMGELNKEDLTFHVDLNMENCPGIAGLELAVKFDNSVINLVGVDFAEEDVIDGVFGDSALSNFMDPSFNSAEANEATFFVSAMRNFRVTEGKVIGYTFKVVDLEAFKASGSETLDLVVGVCTNQTFEDVVAEDVDATLTYAAVESVTLDVTETDLSLGKSMKLNATVNPADAFDPSLVWESTDVNVATVDGNGNVNGVGVGTATITVKAVDDPTKTASCVVTVKKILVESVSLEDSALTMEIGESKAFVATINPSDAHDQRVTWESSDEFIATVDENGVVTARAAGEAVITVTTVDGGKQASCVVTVNFSEDAPYVYIEAEKAKVGEEFKAVISIANNPGVAGLAFELDYDTAAMTLKSISYDSDKWDCESNFNEDSSADPVAFVFYNETNYTESFLVELTFEVKADAECKEYDFDLSHTFVNSNEDGDIVYVSMKDSKIEVSDYEPGDINDDGAINAKDAVLLAQYLARWAVTIEEGAADCNGDGDINAKDAVLLAQYLARWDVTLG